MYANGHPTTNIQAESTVDERLGGWPAPPGWPVWPYPAPSKAKEATADVPTIDFGERVPAHLKSKWKAYVWNHGSEDAR